MTTQEKKARDAESGADNGDARPRLGRFEGSTTFAELVEQQGVRPFVWSEPSGEEDSIDADDFLRAIFGDKMRR